MQSFSRKWNQEIENFQNQGIIEFSLKKAWKVAKILTSKKIYSHEKGKVSRLFGKTWNKKFPIHAMKIFAIFSFHKSLVYLKQHENFSFFNEINGKMKSIEILTWVMLSIAVLNTNIELLCFYFILNDKVEQFFKFNC